MDRQTVYPGQILPETVLLQMAKDSMIGAAKLSSALFGTSTIANGFAVTPTGPASLQVLVAPGEIYSLTSIDATAYSSLAADTTHSIMKQGILLDGLTLSCPAPGTTGQSINYLIQATYQDLDANPVLLPYYNSANPALPFSGIGNNGLTQNTSRKGVALVAVKAGASATTGSQTTPAPDAGYIGLYVVTVAFGQTTITSASISQYASAPLLPSGVVPAIQSNALNYAKDFGTAGVYKANYTPAITTLTDGMVLEFEVLTANPSAATFSPNGIGPWPIIGGAHSALQGGEFVAGGKAELMWHATLSSFVLLGCTGGALQVGTPTKSQHAAQFGQVSGVVGQGRNVFCNIPAASASATITADEFIVESALGGLRYCLSSFNKTINLATVGAGGMDTGTAPVSGWVAVYAAFNPLLALSATNPMLIAKNATSSAQTEVYSGANMPAGYTASGLIAVFRTNASSQFAVQLLEDREVDFYAVIYNGAGTGSFTSVSLVAAVPPNAKRIKSNVAMTVSVTGITSAAICPTAVGTTSPGFSTASGYGTAGVPINFPLSPIPILTPQLIYIASGGVATTYTHNSYGYTF
jgi:hypothetical protein